MRLILASASPRRRQLLNALGFDFVAVPSSVDEDSITRRRPEALARALAQTKARDVSAKHQDAVVLAADTLVVHRGVLLGKPASANQARAMLARLRGRTHRVVTAVCVVAPGHRARVAHVVTRVRMRRYSPAEAAASIARGDPFDKAGGYAIQDTVLRPVASHEGCYCNVVGLPLWTALRLLGETGVTPARPPSMPLACDACVMKPQHLPA